MSAFLFYTVDKSLIIIYSSYYSVYYKEVLVLYQCNKKEGFKDGIPIIMGFIPIAMAFGILCKTAGITLLESLAFSMIVFAGASQFIAVNLLIAGATTAEIILTTLLVNFRHFLFAASLSSKMTEKMKKTVPIIAFGLTDEIFSVASLKEKELTNEYMLVLEACAYLALAVGTAAGFILGGILPRVVQLSMGIALYALFISILVPEMKKSLKVVVLIVMSGIINSICIYVLNLPQGWSVVVSIALVSFMGLFIKVDNCEGCYE